MRADPEYLKWLHRETEILRQPTFGIHSGYHDLPYILLAESEEPGFRTTEIRGQIHVSQKLVVTPGDDAPAYGDLFDPDTMDESIVGRLFAFKFHKRPVNLEMDDFSRRDLEYTMQDAIHRVFDELERREIINTGVIRAPWIGKTSPCVV